MRRYGIICISLLTVASLWAQEQQTDTVTVKRLLQAAPIRSCPFCDMHGANLSGQNLTDVNLVGANLEGADLSNATLSGTLLAGAKLRRAVLDGAHMTRSEKGRTDLSRADVTGASFKGTVFGDADLQYIVGFEPGIEPHAPALESAVWDPKHQRPGRIEAQHTIEAIAGFSCGRADLTKLKSAVYVSPAGQDSQGCGNTFQNACKTIPIGIQQCKGADCGVLVGFGEYQAAGPISLQDGVKVYGGCVPTSQGNPDFQSLINAPSGGRAAIIAYGTKSGNTTLQGFKLVGSPAESAGGASIALKLYSDAKLTVLDTRIIAGPGAPGATASNAGKGGDGNKGDGGTAGGSSCQSSGGKGSVKRTVSVSTSVFSFSCTGSCSANGCSGYSADRGSTSKSANGGGRGGDNCAECPVSRGANGGDGQDGDNAGCGAKGSVSADTAGKFSGIDWVGGSGGNASGGGNSGGGGGGGAGGYRAGSCFWVSTENPGNSGGGGGSGGCAGGGGTGGRQGGASFGIMVLQSTLTLTDSAVVGGIGGAGGRGGDGGQGGKSGDGAGGATNEAGGYGGKGGNGGAGGSGAGGAGGNGGPAIGIALVSGGKVNPTRVQFYAGASGAVGANGAGAEPIKSGVCKGPNGDPGQNGLVADTRVY